jgi:hypothetical protein
MLCIHSLSINSITFRVHIVDKNTGCYLKTDMKIDEPIIYRREQIGFYDNIEKKYDSCEN